jgi:hypothetical protein
MSSFREARDGITGDSWLDELARTSLSAANAKFGGPSEPAYIRLICNCEHDKAFHDPDTGRCQVRDLRGNENCTCRQYQSAREGGRAGCRRPVNYSVIIPHRPDVQECSGG